MAAPVKEQSPMNERLGVGVAIVSCCCGAGAAVATRYLIGAADPITLAAIRFGGGVLCLLPLAALLRRALAAAQRLAGRGRPRLHVLCGVLRLLQRRARLHDGGARHAGALDAAADDHAGRRAARHRGAERAQDRRRPAGHAGRRHRAGQRARARPGRAPGAAISSWRGPPCACRSTTSGPGPSSGARARSASSPRAWRWAAGRWS